MNKYSKILRVVLVAVLCALGAIFPIFFIIAAWVAWTIVDTIRNPPQPDPDEWYFRRWTTTAADPRWKSDFLAFCESPAETQFLEAMITAYGLTPEHGKLKCPSVTLDLQVEVPPYRLDFFVNDWLVVEIDGAAYHSSPEAVARDKVRDEYLRGKGYSVLRIPAKVVFNTPKEAVLKVKSAIAAGRTPVNASIIKSSPSEKVENGPSLAHEPSGGVSLGQLLADIQKLHDGLSKDELQELMGMNYVHGQGLSQSDEEAVEQFRSAADQGDAYGQINLAIAFLLGRGVPQNDGEAARLFGLAANQGNAIAQCKMGWMYERGRGVPRSGSEAARCYRLAADQGYAEAQTQLGIMYMEGHGVPKSDLEAAHLFRLAAEQGDGDADLLLFGLNFRSRIKLQTGEQSGSSID